MNDKPYNIEITVRYSEKSEIFPSNPFRSYQENNKTSKHQIFMSLSFDDLGILKKCLTKLAKEQERK